MAASTRITHGLLVLVLLALLTVIGMLAAGVRGGPLDPPGAPASSDSVRLPGTPISSIPLVITQPGKYYLTRNLTAVCCASGIQINASDVTVDLNGFTLTGTGPGGAASGIEVTSSHSGIRIYNGTLRSWAAWGILAQQATSSEIRGVTALTNGTGIEVGQRSVVRDSIIVDNDFSGIRLNNFNYAHGNMIFNNNRSLSVSNHDVDILGDHNHIVDNFIEQVQFGALADHNNAYRNRVCGYGIMGVNNKIPTDGVFATYEDTGGGHLAIPPERNWC